MRACTSSSSMPEAYGSNLARVLMADVADRLGGRKGRANARLGFLTVPPGDGRIIWIKADADADAVWLAAELAHAVRERRRDVRLIVTFEEEFEGNSRRIKELARAGYGFGPADWPGAVRRVLARFAPLAGVITVGASLRRQLAAALEKAGTPVVAVHGLPPQAAQAAQALPNTAAERRAWGVRAIACAPLMSMIVEAQVEPQFRGVAGARARALWWITDVEEAVLPEVIRQWRASPLSARDLLFVGASGEGPRLSEWTRSPYAPGTVIAVDDARYWPALAASATGIHMRRPGERLFWQVLASGQVVTASGLESFDLLQPAPCETVAAEDLTACWVRVLDDPVAARQRADDIRRYFWQQRRLAQDAVAVLLARVYGW